MGQDCLFCIAALEIYILELCCTTRINTKCSDNKVVNNVYKLVVVKHEVLDVFKVCFSS